MDFIGNRFKRILLILGGVSLFIWVVWPFLRGGHSSIQTAFTPMNAQMEMLLMQEENETKESQSKEAGSKVSATPKARLAAGATAKSTTPENKESNVQTNSSSVGTSDEAPSSEVGATNQTPLATVSEKFKGLLDLNTATVEQLDKLPGIGESKAKAILEYRTKKGRFKRVEELMDVKGIGEKMFEKLKGQVFVAPS